MEDFLGIDLIAGLNQEKTKHEINSTIETLSTQLKDLKLEIDIDKKALQTIKDFNTEMKKLSQAAEKTGQTVNQAISPDGSIEAQTQQIRKLVVEKAKLDKLDKQRVDNTKKNTSAEIRSLNELKKGYQEVNRVITDYNEKGQPTQVQHRLGNNGDIERTVTTDGEGNVLKYRDHDTELQKKRNDILKEITTEREKIADRLAKIRLDGYGSEKQLKLFDERSMSNDINALKTLRKEVDTYGGSMSKLARKSGLSETIRSMNTLHKNGSQKLPRSNMLSDIRKDLNAATTTAEIDKVQKKIQRLQTTLRNREAGFKQLARLKADEILPTGTVSEVRERLRKAESPEQSQKVLGEIPGLQEQNKKIRASNQEMESLTNQRQRLYRKLATIEQDRGSYVEPEKMRMFLDSIPDADKKALNKINNNIDDYGKSLGRMQTLENAQRDATNKAALLTDQVYGRIKPEHQKELDSYIKRMNSLTANTPNLTGEIRNLNRDFDLLSYRVKKADQGMARFTGQMSAALFRIPIYAAGVAAMYAPLRMMSSALQEIIEIDTQMTVLERVTDGAENMNTAMASSIGIAEKLGNTITEVNEGLINFARQGYRDQDLTAITEVATVMSNVSDLSVDDAASSLTAAMKGFNIEAQDSLRIVDAMNEVDNNYSITTQQLAQSIMRSAGAASTYGVEMERSIGYTTAIGEVTRESGNVIGKIVADVKPFLIDLKLLANDVEDNKAQAECHTLAA